MSSMLKRLIARWMPLAGFSGSAAYWQERYQRGGDSGAGSMGAAAHYKARVLNEFVRSHGIGSVVEFGCGDGRQLQLAEYPCYLGVDISAVAIGSCKARFSREKSKRFLLASDYLDDQADLALSLDVLYHLVEDDVYWQYMRQLFAASTRFVIIYSTSTAIAPTMLPHVRHRNVEADVARQFVNFRAMANSEFVLPPPIEYGRGLLTKFMIYERLPHQQ